MIKQLFFLCSHILLLSQAVSAQTNNYEQGAFYNQQNINTTPQEIRDDIISISPTNPIGVQTPNSFNQNLYGNSDPGGPGTGGGGGTPIDGVPIDGGIGFLLVTAAAAGIKKVKKQP
ncbi:MAG: hypothetical protein RIR90_301 [Bacteroidota bacterium]